LVSFVVLVTIVPVVIAARLTGGGGSRLPWAPRHAGSSPAAGV